MFLNYLKVGFRNILKFKVFSFINVFGLAVAMSICMLIIHMLLDQKGYDQFHTKKGKIYRILSNMKSQNAPSATTPMPLADALKAEYPIVKTATQLSLGATGDAKYNERVVEMRGYFADSSFFEVFDFALAKGKKENALILPSSMVITADVAKRLFGDEDPIGKVVDFYDRQLPFPLDYGGVGAPPVLWGPFTITGVLAETGEKSHLKFDVLVSSASLPALYLAKRVWNVSNAWEVYYKCYTYVVLQDGSGKDDLQDALNSLVEHKFADMKSEQAKDYRMVPQKLSEVQLGLVGNDTNNRMPMEGYYFLSFLALIIIISACLNYTNLSIARALTRAKEIGVRKVTGANTKAVMFQFLSESVIMSLLAMITAVALLFFIKPAFKNLWVNKHLNFELKENVFVYLLFIVFAIVIGVIAGLYPAFYLSKFQPIKALKSLNNVRAGKLRMRKVLSGFQFVVSLIFVTTTILIFNQFEHYMRFQYGFTANNIVNVEMQGNSYQKILSELSSVPGVTKISACEYIPATGRSVGIDLKNVGSVEDYKNLTLLNADENFVTNLDLKIIAGKNLPELSDSSKSRFILVNKSATEALGFKIPLDILGHVFEAKEKNEQLEVIGVVEDFRFALLINQDKIGPLVLRNQPKSFNYVNVRIASGDLMRTVSKVEDKWKTVDPVHPFKYEFFEDQLAATHQAIGDVVTVLGFIAFMAVSIACLGLLGMATYTVERRIKEVSIRKVLGAEDLNIAFLLSKGFLTTLGTSIFIAAPASYFLNNLWLESFPNRVEFGLGTVFIGASILLILGLIPIVFQTIKASRRNPVDVLRIE